MKFQSQKCVFVFCFISHRFNQVKVKSILFLSSNSISSIKDDRSVFQMISFYLRCDTFLVEIFVFMVEPVSCVLVCVCQYEFFRSFPIRKNSLLFVDPFVFKVKNLEERNILFFIFFCH